TIELADGQSFALAGLLNNNVAATTDAIPLLGDIPILGDLFRSTKYQHSQTELVVLVTPRLVEPMSPDKTPALPGETCRYPDDGQIYLWGDLGGPEKKSSHKGPAPRFHGTYGFSPVGAGGADAMAD